MAQTAVLRPKRPAWMRSTTFVAGIVLAAYLWLAWATPWHPGRFWGLLAGSVAAALFVNAALYPARRRWRAWPLGTAQRWLQLHIYGSTLGALLVLVHVGFRLPAGMMGWSLLGLTVWTAGSGLVGVYLQKALPLTIQRHLKFEAIYERIPELIRQLVEEADAAMRAASPVVARAYGAEIRPLLVEQRPSWSYLMNPVGDRVRVLRPVQDLMAVAEEADREGLRDVESIVQDKLDLDVQASLQRALRVWIVTHVPAAILLLGLIGVHVFAVVYF